VRHAGPEFTDTIQHAECTQTYKPHCTQPKLDLVSAHNGYLRNYQQLKTQLQLKHLFESEPTKLIDSEIIPHLHEEQLTKTKNPTKAAHTLYEKTQGRNTIITMHTNTDTNQANLDIKQKGKTRGLTIWTNPDNAVLLCSREKPAQTAFNGFLKENKYQQIVHLTRNDAANLEAHFTMTLNQHTQTAPQTMLKRTTKREPTAPKTSYRTTNRPRKTNRKPAFSPQKIFSALNVQPYWVMSYLLDRFSGPVNRLRSSAPSV
jgi:hypothetical protein